MFIFFKFFFFFHPKTSCWGRPNFKAGGGPVTLDKTVTILRLKSRLSSLCEMKTNRTLKTSGSSMKKSSEKL